MEQTKEPKGKRGSTDRGFYVQTPFVLLDMDMGANATIGFIRFLKLFQQKDKTVVYRGSYRGLGHALGVSTNTAIRITQEWLENDLATKEDTPTGIAVTANIPDLWANNKEYCENFYATQHRPAKGSRAEQLHTMPYLEYLKTPEWEARRKRILKLASYRCQVCNAANTSLHVHHRTYIRRGYELDQDLIALCEDCHQMFHDNGRLEVEA